MTRLVFRSFPDMPPGGLPAHYAADRVIFDAIADAGIGPDYDRKRAPCFIARRDGIPVAHIHVAPADIMLAEGAHTAAGYLREHLGTPMTKRLLVLFLHDGIGPGRRGREAEEETRVKLGFRADEIVFIENADKNQTGRDALRERIRKLLAEA